jgi:hypothetical protein
MKWTGGGGGGGRGHADSVSSSFLVVVWCISWILLLLVGNAHPARAAASASASSNSNNYFNFEVEKRILERLDFYLNGPVGVNDMIQKFRTNGGFPHDMLSADRDSYLALAYAMPQPLVYFGLEDGTCLGYVYIYILRSISDLGIVYILHLSFALWFIFLRCADAKCATHSFSHSVVVVLTYPCIPIYPSMLSSSGTIGPMDIIENLGMLDIPSTILQWNII